MTENWKPVVGYEGAYEASDLGRVRSLDRLDNRGHRVAGRVLRDRITPYRKNQASLCRNGIVEYRYVARIVLESFRGPCPYGMEACHGDGDSLNDSLSNLRWDTHISNCQDRIAHGTSPVGLRHGMARLNETDIECVFDLRRAGCTMKQIGDWMGISAGHACRILKGKSWSHLGAAA